jgi:hypothetical protein
MKGFVYRNTRSVVWGNVHTTQPRGMAYETNTHFVHVYGKADGLWVISTGLTVAEVKQDKGTLHEWIVANFGAEDIEECANDVGATITGVWRPGLYYDDEMLQGLAATDAERRNSEQALLLLVQRLDELLLFIEPSTKTLDAYGHKSRELLILACTEVEAQWKHYLTLAGRTPLGQGSTTKDYVTVLESLFLAEFEIELPRYKELDPLRPFLGWSTANPTKSLPWYDAYNKTKHDRANFFSEATLRRCIEAVGACVVLFSVRFGPIRLYQGAGTLPALINASFSIRLRDCKPVSFYIPELMVEGWTNRTGGQANVQPRKPAPFKLP